METLQVLEQRITRLITFVKKLQEENAQLVQDYACALQKIEGLESSILQHNNNLEVLSSERKQTIYTVDELIKIIDTFVGEEQQP